MSIKPDPSCFSCPVRHGVAARLPKQLPRALPPSPRDERPKGEGPQPAVGNRRLPPRTPSRRSNASQPSLGPEPGSNSGSAIGSSFPLPLRATAETRARAGPSSTAGGANKQTRPWLHTLGSRGECWTVASGGSCTSTSLWCSGTSVALPGRDAEGKGSGRNWH
jgi:hypothetical protein